MFNFYRNIGTNEKVKVRRIERVNKKGCKQKVFVAVTSRKSDDREQNTTMSKSTEQYQ